MSSTNTSWSNESNTKANSTIASTVSDVNIPATSKLYLDGGNNTYLTETSADLIDIYAGGVKSLSITSNSITVGVDDTGHDVKFFGASAGAFCLYDESEDTLEIRGPSADATTSTGKLKLTTALTNINVGDILGRIDFAAPLESSGSDAILSGASIWAVADSTFGVDNNSTELVFATNASAVATERMRIDFSGNVGIGTSSPAGSSSLCLDIENTTTNGTGEGGCIRLSANDGTVMANTERLGVVEFAGLEGSGVMTIGARIEAVADATWSSSENGASLDFYTTDGNAVQTQRMTILASGNVGIGTAEPDGTLHIVSSAEGGFADGGAVTPQLIVEGTGSAAGSTSPFVVLHNSSAAVDNDFIGKVSFTGDDETGDATGDLSVGTEYASIFCRILDATDNTTDGALYFATDVNDTKTDTMVLTGGNVGIGTTVPESLLHIYSSTSDKPQLIIDHKSALADTDVQGGTLRFRLNDSDGAHIADDMVLGDIIWAGAEDDGTTFTSSAVIRARTTGTWSDTSSPTELAFYTCNTSSQTANQRMTILHDGNVGIGTTDPTFKFEAESSLAVVKFYRTSNTATADILDLYSDVGSTEALVWRVEADGDTFGAEGGTYTSDERMKKNIVTVQDALSKVNSLRGATFEWKYAGKEGTRYGLIAQEVVQVIPEIVRYDGLDAPQELKDEGVDVTMGLNYTGLIPVLIEAVKELSAKVEVLENS